MQLPQLHNNDRDVVIGTHLKRTPNLQARNSACLILTVVGPLAPIILNEADMCMALRT